MIRIKLNENPTMTHDEFALFFTENMISSKSRGNYVYVTNTLRHDIFISCRIVSPSESPKWGFINIMNGSCLSGFVSNINEFYNNLIIYSRQKLYYITREKELFEIMQSYVKDISDEEVNNLTRDILGRTPRIVDLTDRISFDRNERENDDFEIWLPWAAAEGRIRYGRPPQEVISRNQEFEGEYGFPVDYHYYGGGGSTGMDNLISNFGVPRSMLGHHQGILDESLPEVDQSSYSEDSVPLTPLNQDFDGDNNEVSIIGDEEQDEEIMDERIPQEDEEGDL